MYLKPRIKREITDINPKDHTQTFDWLLPWKDLLSHRNMTELIVPLKLKLSTSLSDWKPDQPWAKALLMPLVPLFDQ